MESGLFCVDTNDVFWFVMAVLADEVEDFTSESLHGIFPVAARWAALASLRKQPAILPPGWIQKSAKWAVRLWWVQVRQGFLWDWAANANAASGCRSSQRQDRPSSWAKQRRMVAEKMDKSLAILMSCDWIKSYSPVRSVRRKTVQSISGSISPILVICIHSTSDSSAVLSKGVPLLAQRSMAFLMSTIWAWSPCFLCVLQRSSYIAWAVGSEDIAR